MPCFLWRTLCPWGCTTLTCTPFKSSPSPPLSTFCFYNFTTCIGPLAQCNVDGSSPKMHYTTWPSVVPKMIEPWRRDHSLNAALCRYVFGQLILEWCWLDIFPLCQWFSTQQTFVGEAFILELPPYCAGADLAMVMAMSGHHRGSWVRRERLIQEMPQVVTRGCHGP